MAHFSPIPRSPVRGPLRDAVRDPVRQANGSAAFISNWQTDNTGTSNNDQISLPLEASGTYNFLVDWGDSSSDTITVFNQAEVTHTYASAGNFDVTITGTIDGWRFNDAGDEEKLLVISNWGPLLLGNGGDYFDGGANLTITATDILDTSAITTMFSAFKGCSSLTTIPNMDMWDMSSVTTTGSMFQAATVFNRDLNAWTLTSLTVCNSMFRLASAYNSPVNDWDMSSVTNATTMFRDAIAFNQPVDNWDMGAATLLEQTFNGATVFNQDISAWNVASVTNATLMLNGTAFSQTNYDLLLVAWDALALQSAVTFDAGPAKFSTAGPATARTNMKSSDLWVITDGGFDLTSIPNMEQYLDAGDTATVIGHPGSVSQWDDQTTNGFDDIQGTGTAQPTSGTNTLNSLNVITTDGNDTMLIPSGLNGIPNGDNTVFVLCRRATEDGGAETIFAYTQGGPARFALQFNATAGRLNFVHNTSNNLIFNSDNTNTNFQLIRTRREGTTQALAVDGGTEVTDTNAANVTGITDRDIFALNQISTFLTGDMAFMLTYARSLSTSEISEVEDIFSAERFGVP